MKNLLLVCDPISSRNSVQFLVLSALVEPLSKDFSIKVITPYIPDEKKEELLSKFGIEVLSISEEKKLIKLLFKRIFDNESMMWSASWILESLFRSNSSIAFRYKLNFDSPIIINFSYTVPISCDIFWNQATPPVQTLSELSRTNKSISFVFKWFSWLIKPLDHKVLNSNLSEHSLHLCNSKYLAEIYNEMGIPVDGIVHSPRKLMHFTSSINDGNGKYVLAYIGKETEISTLIELADKGVKIIGFGSKVPYGTDTGELKKKIDFRGYVTESELQELYLNAKFTVFPFTEEPFGFIPIESMYFGTPILTYDRQGPAETVEHNKTGWLASSTSELVSQGVLLWNSGSTGIDPYYCRQRALEFSSEREVGKLINYMGILK